MILSYRESGNNIVTDGGPVQDKMMQKLNYIWQILNKFCY